VHTDFTGDQSRVDNVWQWDITLGGHENTATM